MAAGSLSNRVRCSRRDHEAFLHGEDVPDRPCCSLDSVNDARRVCEQLGIHTTCSIWRPLRHDWWTTSSTSTRAVARRFRASGATPSRNSRFPEEADAIDAQWIATGHYARVVDGGLLRGLDENKDQTISCGNRPRGAVAPDLPVGTLDKAQTRVRAHAMGLDVIAEKPESQEICFVPDRDYARILEQRLPVDAPALSRGPIMTSGGAVVGEHNGFARYTVGQRRGVPGGFAHPMYVIAIRPDQRAVVIGTRDELLGSGIVAREVNWLSDAPRVGDSVSVRVRRSAAARTGRDSSRRNSTRSSWRSTSPSRPSRPASPSRSTTVRGCGAAASSRHRARSARRSPCSRR